MPDRSQQEHLAILEALEAHDPDAARQAMAEHLDAVTRIFARPAME
jgi:DNA-binding FadR family transcriptional regulator